ncbi:MAG: porin [candidate division Zixibacteria bacterium]|nr:porin [Candidatus Tariuqbacter arcticus]
MRNLLTASIVLALLFAFSLPVFACGEGEECEGGICVEDVKFKLAGNFQTLLLLKAEDLDKVNTGPIDQFKMGRARLFLKGTVLPEKFYFVTQVELGYYNQPLLDFKFIYAGLPMNTYFTFGRFKPNFTYYMPRSTAKLDFANYPLLVQHFGMNWQMGAQTTTNLGILKLNLGVFNGQDIPNNFTDNNKYKDFLVRTDFMYPLGPGKLDLAGYGWFGTGTGEVMEVNPDTTEVEEIPYVSTGGVEQFANSRFGFTAAYTFGPMNVRAEYVASTDEQFKNPTGAVIEDFSRSSYYFQAGYKFMQEKMEALVRYEMYDQDTDVDKTEKTWLTLGLNYYLHEWKTMLYLNYIMRDAGDDYEPELTDYKAGKNDMILLQAQMAF